MHEAGVRTVLKQTPNQVGQQVLVFSNRCIDAATALGILQYDVVQPFAHSMQPLEFERTISGEGEDCGNGMGVMGGKLGVNTVAVAKELFRMGDIADIGRYL